MVRISDARMSGTAYGTVVLHVAPEAAAGGPLALVRDGDMIELDVEARRLQLDVSDEELARRRAEWTAAEAGTGQRLRAAVRGARASRRTRAPTSTSCAAAAATRCPGSRTEQRPSERADGSTRSHEAHESPLAKTYSSRPS